MNSISDQGKCILDVFLVTRPLSTEGAPSGKVGEAPRVELSPERNNGSVFQSAAKNTPFWKS